jgi:hypothetical protein
VEEDYKAIKCRMELENFTGKSVLSVYQDFHAKGPRGTGMISLLSNLF